MNKLLWEAWAIAAAAEDWYLEPDIEGEGPTTTFVFVVYKRVRHRDDEWPQTDREIARHEDVEECIGLALAALEAREQAIDAMDLDDA